MAAGISDDVWDIEETVGLLDVNAVRMKRGLYKKTIECLDFTPGAIYGTAICTGRRLAGTNGMPIKTLSLILS